MMMAGYVGVSQLNVYDEAFNREEEHDFQNILDDAIEEGAKVLWDTYNVFEINGMVFASVIVNIESMEELNIPIIPFDDRLIGAY